MVSAVNDLLLLRSIVGNEGKGLIRGGLRRLRDVAPKNPTRGLTPLDRAIFLSLEGEVIRYQREVVG